MKNGRPLRFLLLTLGGWTGLRTVMLWPDPLPQALPPPLPSLLRLANAAPPPALASAPAQPAPSAAAQPADARRGSWSPSLVVAPATPPRMAVARATPGEPIDLTLALAALVRFDQAEVEPQGNGAIPPPLRPTPVAGPRSRLAASAWLITRGGSGGTLLGGQLGGSQAGTRLTYALGEARRVAVAARVATPLSGRGREAALGLEWQPTRAPLRLVAEQRLSLDGGKGGPTLMAIGGIGPTPIAAGFRLESYAQAGAIARHGVEAFADGAARLAHPVASLGGTTLDAGAGTWGAAQRGAARLDVGPSLGLVVPVAHHPIRLTLDYRYRVAGEARPGSGVALAIGSDF